MSGVVLDRIVWHSNGTLHPQHHTFILCIILDLLLTRIKFNSTDTLLQQLRETRSPVVTAHCTVQYCALRSDHYNSVRNSTAPKEIMASPHSYNLPLRTAFYCTAALYSFVLCCTVLYCTVLYCTVLYCTVLYCTVLYCTVLYCAVLYCTVLYCTALHCTCITW
jgi:hypothetical protein